MKTGYFIEVSHYQNLQDNSFQLKGYLNGLFKDLEIYEEHKKNITEYIENICKEVESAKYVYGVIKDE